MLNLFVPIPSSVKWDKKKAQEYLKDYKTVQYPTRQNSQCLVFSKKFPSTQKKQENMTQSDEGKNLAQ